MTDLVFIFSWHYWPQWLVGLLFFGRWLIGINEHNKPRTATYTMQAETVAVALWVALLHIGGFW